MKPLFPIVVAILVIAANAHPENIEQVKELPQSHEPVLEAEASEPQARTERCTACAGTHSLKSPKELLASLKTLPNSEIHTQSSFEECSSEKGCAGVKIKDGKIIEKFGNLQAFKAAANADSGNEFQFQAAGNSVFEGGVPNGGPFWWMNQDSPFKNGGGSFEKFSKSSSSFTSSSNTGGGVDLGANPFLNGGFSKLAGGAGFTGAGGNFAGSQSFESSSSTKEIDISKNPFLSGAASTGFGGQSSFGSSQGGFGAGQSGFNSFSSGSSKFGSGYTGSSPAPFAPSAGANVNLIQNSQKNEFDFAQQTQQNIDEVFQSTGNVNAHENAGGDLQQTCAGQGYVCVLKSQCNNGVVNTNGGGLLQANTQKQYCNTRTEICCRIETSGAGLQGTLGVGSGFQASQGSGVFQSGSSQGSQSSFGSGFNANRGSGTQFGSGAGFNSNKFGATGSSFGSGFKSTSQSNFVETDSFSAGSENNGVFRPGAVGSGLKPGVPYLPPIDTSTSGSNVVTTAYSPAVITTPRPFSTPRPVTTPRPYSTPKPYVPSTKAPEYLPPIDGITGSDSFQQPSYIDGQLILDQNLPGTVRPVVISDVPAGCAAALKCTPIEYCTAEGIISNTTVVLTRDQEAYRVPLTDCKDISTGLIGKCCRDPFYTDPWPVNQIGQWVPGVFGGNDGKYVPDNRGSSNNQPGVTVRPPVTGNVLLNNFRNPNPKPTVPSVTPATVQKTQYGQGSYSQGGQGQIAIQGQGQYAIAGQGQANKGAGGQFAQGSSYSQTTSAFGQGQTGGSGQAVIQGQGSYLQGGQGTLVQQGVGYGIKQGSGQVIRQGQGSTVSSGQGIGVVQGGGQIVSQGGGQTVSQGFGTGIRQGSGSAVIQGQGQYVSQGQGQLVSQGQGTAIKQGQGFGVIQGQGQAVSQGGGQIVTQGGGQLVSQGGGQLVSQGQGFGVSQGQGQGVSQGVGIGVIQGQGATVSRGQGFAVTGGQGQYTTQGQGSLVSKGQGQIVNQGLGFGVTQGQGQIVSQGQGTAIKQGQGFGLSQGGGATISQGGGFGISQGGGATVSQGGGFGISQGGGYGVSQGIGYGIRQGSGQAVITGQGQAILQGQGQKLIQGQGYTVSNGGYGVENEFAESVQRVYLPRYSGAGGECGILNPQKPYGNRKDLEVDFAEIPWQAMILLKTNKSLLCGGVITRPDVVITSASCVEGLKAENVLIKGGEWKLGIDEEPLPFQIVQVKTILRHPLYKSGNYINDAAILVLSENLRLAKNIWPICLPSSKDTLDAFYNGAGQCVVTGWGKSVLQAHLLGSIMHSMNVSLLNPGECQSKITQDYPHLLEHYEQESCVCGQPKNPANNICKVDIGSALACTTDDNHWILRGIYSWDSGCQTGNQLASFYKFDLEWYEWAIGLIESVRFEKYTVVKYTKGKIITQGTGTKTTYNTGVKETTGFGIKGSSGFGVKGSSGFGIKGSGASATAVAGSGLGVAGSGLGIAGQGQSGQFSQFGTGSGEFSTEVKGPIQNTFTTTFTEKKFFQTEPKYVTYTTKPEIISYTTKPEIISYTTKPKIVTYTTKPEIISYTTKPEIISYTTKPKIVTYTTKPEIVTYTTKPEIVTFTTKPEYFTYTTKPKYVTYTTKPEIVTYTTKPEIVTYTTKPEIITYTTKPKIVTYTTKPQIIRFDYQTSGSQTSQQVVAPSSFNPSFSEVVGAGHVHDAKCKCVEGK